MQYIISAQNITDPTYETVESYSKKRFAKIEKLLPKLEESDYEIRIGVEKSGDLFDLTVRISGGPLRKVATTKDRDIRKAIDMAVDIMQREIVDEKSQ